MQYESLIDYRLGDGFNLKKKNVMNISILFTGDGYGSTKIIFKMEYPSFSLVETFPFIQYICTNPIEYFDKIS